MQDSADTVTKDLLVEPAKRGRKPLAAAVPVVVDADLAPVAQAVAVLDERASRVRAVALQMGYQLPGDGVDADLIQRDIAANMRRSVEACLEVGRGLAVLKEAGLSTEGLSSKSWDNLTEKPDAVITLCADAAGEACPAWPGQPITAHWGFADPTKIEGDREKQLKAFSNAQFQIANRIRLFMSLPIEKIDRMSLQTKLRELGQQRDA